MPEIAVFTTWTVNSKKISEHNRQAAARSRHKGSQQERQNWQPQRHISCQAQAKKQPQQANRAAISA